MPLVASNEYIQVGGKVDVLVAMPVVYYVAPEWPFNPARGTTPGTASAAYQQLFKLGELMEEVTPRKRKLRHQVPGDRYGGSAGAPIETQYLGHMFSIGLELSRYDPEVWQMLCNYGGLHSATVKNALPLGNYGALELRDRSFRLLLFSNRDARLHRNYPCCVIADDHSVGMGTKFSALSVRVEAHRCPEGHWSDPTGVLGTSTSIGCCENLDVTGTT